MRKLLTLLLFASAVSADKTPKPRFVEDRVPGHPELTGHHWACPKGWEVAGKKPPFKCVRAKPIDQYDVVTGGQ